MQTTFVLVEYAMIHNWERVQLGFNHMFYIDGLVQERRNSIASALELRLSGTNQSISNKR